jgi:hypothetical protein
MRVISTMASGTRHVAGVGLQALLIAAIVAALAFAAATLAGNAPAGAGSVFAGRNQTSWIDLAQASANVASSQPSLGSSVAFSTGYPTSVKNPRIEVLCYQNGSLVYGEAGGVNDSFQLGGGGSIWLTNGGAASCTANLFYFGSHAGKQTYNVLASTDFEAN